MSFETWKVAYASAVAGIHSREQA
ncbi:hypothetical protein A2U01_0066991 [Trifolium medium]|uniref:Uncharacterized protein n=1 Tax=Trifolium medium TaxID=97028 RepID=A0A392SBA7_9FABA|nr:hypothetical protein [Trifolium medium]